MKLHELELQERRMIMKNNQTQDVSITKLLNNKAPQQQRTKHFRVIYSPN